MAENKKKKGRAAPPEPVQQMEVDDNKDGESDEEEEFPVPEGGISIPTRDGNIYIPPAPPAVCSMDSTGPRLVITYIENDNFKSYAGRRVLGPFHKSFTSIIGPNGSGKSNVIDSMLFVFGYRASKIRSKKISVLLHKSENHRDIRSCTVAVNFAHIIDIDEDNYEYVPDSKFKIARTAFADSSSFYTINGKRAHFKQVTSLLLEKGIDLIHNRFLILQGEVEQIAMMKPKAPTEHESGMLEYLEDIVGTSRYKVPIEKLSQEVELLNEERTEKKNRLVMAEKEKDALEGPMGEAVSYLEGCNELTLLKNKAYQAEHYEYRKQLEQQEKEKEDKENGMTELKTRLKDLAAELEEYKTDIQQSETEHNSIHDEREKKSEAYRQMEAQDAAYTEEMKQVNNKRKKVKEQLKQEQKKLEDAESLPEKNAKEIEELKVVLERLNKQRAKEQEEVTNTLAGLREETQELQESKERLQTTLTGLKTTVDEARQKHDLKESELNIYLSNEQKEKSKLDQLNATLTKTSDKLKERRITLAELDEKLPQARTNLQAAQEELVQLRREEATTVQELQRRRVTLDERRVAMSSNRSRGRVLDFLNQQKQEGTIPGIFGRLGDLGGIDGKYDVAVSTACGPLDNIVVDTVRTGEACVAALKRHNVGRATFICLEKQQHLPNIYTRPFQAPENVPRLFDLIQVADDRVRPAFYYALRDTVVASDLDQATRIGYGRVRYRIVTLKGELIETYGTMSGGGNSVSRGRMGRAAAAVVDASPGEMGRMEHAVGELERRVQAARARIAQLEATVEKLTRDVRLWSTDVNKFRVEVDGLSSQEPVLRQQVKAQEARVREVAPDKGTVNKMRAAVDAAKKELDKAEREAGKIEVQVQAVTDEIQQITGNRTNAAQKKLQDVVKKADKISSEITKLGVAIKTAERTIKKSSEAVKNMEADIKQAEDRLTKLKEQKDNLMEKAKCLVKEVEALSKKEVEFEEILEEKKTRVGNKAKEENELKASKFKEDQIIKAILTKINELKGRIAQKENQLKKLQMKIIPNKEVEMELKVYDDEALAEIEFKKIDYKITTLEEQLKKETPNLKVIDDYYAKLNQCEQRLKDVDEVTARRNDMRQWHENVRKSRLTEFMTGFTIITDKLKEMYQMITLGGDAELELVDSLDPFTEGIVFSVRPPKKSWKHISNLSGGEKTLSSLALVFALHYYKPTPLYVMDEIDAALDFKNVSIVGHYIKERTKNAQFIIISLRANMFELADTLVGIFKVHNCTDSATITPGVYTGKSANQNGVASEGERGREAEQAMDVVRVLADRTHLLNEPSTSQSPPRKVARKLTNR